jgi:glutamyl-tRNA reductase
MIQVIGIRKNVEVHIREKLSILSTNLEDVTKELLMICNEVVILSTCNRTEIYFSAPDYNKDMLEGIFTILKWDKVYMEHVFYLRQNEAVKHLLEVACGFHSKILGEDQILGQIKKSFEFAKNSGAAGKYLSRLFQTSITCSKQFRNKSLLQEMPISSSSIVIKEAKKRNVRKYMIIGYGEVGQLIAKYILDNEFDILYIAVRNPDSVDISGPNIKVVDFRARMEYYQDVECIISCTGAPGIVLQKAELPQKRYLIFDLAVPRDVEESIADMCDVELYDIDMVSALHDETYTKRKISMESNRYIINEAMESYVEWLDIDSLAPVIQKMSQSAHNVSAERLRSFRNKMNTKDNLELAETMIKSTSNAFLNRAIEVLKDEYLNGRGEECLNIVKKIFQIEQ